MNGKKRRVLSVALALLMGASLLSTAAYGASYKVGSSGETVSKIQQKLKEWGYYDGAVDGVFGKGTEKAVRWFQEKNGLSVDGKVGQATIDALGIDFSPSSGSGGGDEALLARLISAEARGEPYSGQVAVGAVVLNRVDHPSFPNTISGVIYQSGAFSCLYDGQWDEPVADSAYKAAREAMAGADPTGGAIYYFNPVTATNKWIWSRPHIITIGKHRFCS